MRPSQLIAIPCLQQSWFQLTDRLNKEAQNYSNDMSRCHQNNLMNKSLHKITKVKMQSSCFVPLSVRVSVSLCVYIMLHCQYESANS